MANCSTQEGNNFRLKTYNLRSSIHTYTRSSKPATEAVEETGATLESALEGDWFDSVEDSDLAEDQA